MVILQVPLQRTDDETLQKELSVLRKFNIFISREASFSLAANVPCKQGNILFFRCDNLKSRDFRQSFDAIS